MLLFCGKEHSKENRAVVSSQSIALASDSQKDVAFLFLLNDCSFKFEDVEFSKLITS